MNKMAVLPDWQALYPQTRKSNYPRPHSSPCKVPLKNSFQNMFRPSSSTSTTAIANPILSSSDIKRILFQKISDKRDELKKAFQLLDTGQNQTVSKNELRRAITTFLLPLTREQFQDVLAQLPLTSSGSVPYMEFLSKFGGIDLNINVIKRGNGSEMDSCRTLKELESQIGEKVHKNKKTIIKAFQLIDINNTGRVRPQELRRILETFCLKMKEEEYQMFSKHYSLDQETAVDYSVFLKNLNISNDLNARYLIGNQEIPRESHSTRSSKSELINSELSEDMWKNCSLSDIQNILSQELLKSYQKVEKALSAGDPCRGGYVSLNYLKVVLDTFVYPLPRKIFIQLMRRLGFRTTAKINWKQFLTSFYEQQRLETSNAPPSQRRNGVSPQSRFRKENIIRKLFKYSEDRSISLKKALLKSNTTPDGQIKWEDLRYILDCMVVKLSDTEFKELRQVFDPDDLGVVNISSFMDLLEDVPRTRKISLNTDSKIPFLLAWDSVEEKVQDAIFRNQPAFYDMLQSYDLGNTGIIGRNNFKKVMRTFCPFLTNEQFIRLCNKFHDLTSGRIFYKKLMAYLGVNGHPAVSPSSKDKPGGQTQKQEPKNAGLPRSIQSPENKTMTKEEVIEKLKNCIQQQDPVFRKHFLDISKDLDRKIAKQDFRKVLEDSGMPMEDTQFAELISKIGYGKEGMSYLDFAAGFEDSKMSQPVASPALSPLPSKPSSSSHLITAEECLRLFPKRLKEFFPDPYAAFFKIDTDMDGIISMHDFYRLLLQLLLNMKDDEFERFLGLLGLRLSVTLNFREFRNLCEKRPLRTDDAPQRLIRTKQKVADSELACEQAHQYLVAKAKNRWVDLSKNFIETDTEGNGILRRRDIKNALYGFDIPLMPREFERLWHSYDREGRGYITYQEFLQRLGISFLPAVHRPNKEDYFNFMGHFTKPQQLQEEIQELHQVMEKTMPARAKLMDHYKEISKALSTQDKAKVGSVSLFRLYKLLQDCGCPLKEEELTQLISSLEIEVHENSINYLDFLRALESSGATGPQSIDFSTLSPEEIVKSIQCLVSCSQQALFQVFSAVDKEDTGFVKATDFGKVLKDFCYKLTDNQYHYFLRKLKIHLTPFIHWKYFLQNFSSFTEEAADEWAEKMPKDAPLQSPHEMGSRDLLARLHKAVTAHYHTFIQEFENFDTLKSNTIARDEFRSICARHMQILTDEQFDRLWAEMPVNSRGKLKYQDLLSRLSSLRPASPASSASPATEDSTATQRGSSTPEISEDTRCVSSPNRDTKTGSKGRSHLCTPASGNPPLQNCESTETKLRKQIHGCWRELLRECKERDVDKQGSIAAPDFLALVEKFHLNISKEESQKLLVKYDLKNNGQFAYCDFIQSCVLLLKAKETSLMRRLKIQNANKMKEPGVDTPSFYNALLRIQPKILHCWRPMRRSFKAYDEGGTGLLSVTDFKKVLRQYSINLSEEEFFHVLEYYDKTLSSKISYNDFLRAFLQ
ncbi:EF-hand calcium-binding domain-containing protein 6 [Dipodomys spectabilis]|uniref:EF-hand calcium-binding domain-containing protein 6 n=1 Tax=Dipodomys spectabilis TaxID=105255 RepID=UPI001C536CE8|nr:EF-hand calcium-binding domain-containing protein 6 [Dipodomys spectabilis]